MARRCELTGKSGMFGNTVSKSNRKVRCTFLPNLAHVTLESALLYQSISVRICTRVLRTVVMVGGLDIYLLKKAKPKLLSKRMFALYKKVKKKYEAQADEAALEKTA